MYSSLCILLALAHCALSSPFNVLIGRRDGVNEHGTSTWLAGPAKVDKSPRSEHNLPEPVQFATDKGSKWKITFEGTLKFTGQIGQKSLGGDKGRTGRIGNRTIWNFGDLECQANWQVCGFSMGAAFYGTDSVTVVDTSAVTGYVKDFNFVQPWSGDPTPVSPQWAWGMDTSNVVSINDTHGVAYAWEIWRGAPDGSIVDRGNAVASITIGHTRPIATRVGPLLSGPDSIQLGLLAVLRDGPYIYTYSVAGASNLVIGRVQADDSVFDATKYTFLSSSSTAANPIWVSTGGIPSKTSLNGIGATTANPSGQFGCAVYGSVYFNTYLQKYMIVCNIYMNFVNMYISATPWGPWSAEYGLMNGPGSGLDAMAKGSYGSMVHEMYGDGKDVYFSMGPNSVFNVFKLDLSGY